MLVQYQFFEMDELFIQKYIGEWSTEHYSAFLSDMSGKPYFKRAKKVLTDLRSVTKMNDAFDNMEKLQNIRRKLLPGNMHNVQLVNLPNATAAVHLYQQELLGEFNYSYCSTLSGALKLLDLSGRITETEIEKLLKNLEHEFSGASI